MKIKSLAPIGSYLVLVVAMLIFSLTTGGHTHHVKASASLGLQATVATSSLLAVGPQNNMFAFGTTTRENNYSCAARIISTQNQPIMISFGSVSSTTLGISNGTWQAASTSIAYDGGLFGCGYMTIRGLNASSSITITETR